MLKCCGASLLEHLEQVFNQVWKDGCIPQEWKDSIIAPIPKKGDFSICNNWRGISLLDIVESCLQRSSNSQCGFRRGKVCVNKIFFVLGRL